MHLQLITDNYKLQLKLELVSVWLSTLKTIGRQFDNFVVTGGTVSCRNDNLRCQQWWKNCQIDGLLSSVYMHMDRMKLRKYIHDITEPTYSEIVLAIELHLKAHQRTIIVGRAWNSPEIHHYSPPRRI